MDSKTLFKKNDYVWKRFRRSLKGKPTAEELADKLPKLKALSALQKAGLIDLVFSDETGFSLTPYVPYGWQKRGTQTKISTHGKNIQNTFGLLNPSNKALHTYSTSGIINSQFICQSLNDFADKINRPTVVLMDNAPWHKSKMFMRNIKAWNQKDLYIFHLPRYSPHLNIIEILWRFIKYKWLQPKHYNSKTALMKRLKYIFSNFGN